MNNLLSVQAVQALLEWYGNNKRDLPWRHTSDPYAIWISEIMLQQTRVDAVKPYYHRFLQTCPTVQTLASLPQEKLMKLWEGLGYYSRARNLQKAAIVVVEQYGGEMPRTYSELLKLCGIGAYTAGAIASIAYGERVPAVDGNVLRVLSRVSGSYEDIAKQETKDAMADALLPIIPPQAGDFNQALIEIGATVCVPNGEARCAFCPLAFTCVAHRQHLTDELPVKSAKKPRKIQEKTVLLITDGEHTALHKRPETGLLAGLFELPNTEGFLKQEQVADYVRTLGFEPLQVKELDSAKHIFTHIEWQMVGYAVRISPEFDGFHGQSGMLLVNNQTLHEEYAVPSAFSAYKKYL